MDFGALLQEHNRRSQDEDSNQNLSKSRKRPRTSCPNNKKTLEANNSTRGSRDFDMPAKRSQGRYRDPPKGNSSKRHSSCRYVSNSCKSNRPWKGKEGCARYLIILAAGDNSMHDDEEYPWYRKVIMYSSSQKNADLISGPEIMTSPEDEKLPKESLKYSTDKFDLCIIYYGENHDVASRYENQCKYFFRRQGPKWQLIRHVLKQGFWKNYEYIWFPDDDLKISMKNIAKMFDVASNYRISMGQPSLHNVNVQKQYAGLLVHRPKLVLHFTNFVEIMCPFFRFDTLELIADTIDDDNVKSGWGLDILWPTMLNFKNIAVIDATPLTHTRPQNAFNLQNSFYTKYKIDPQRECFDLLTKYRISDFKKNSFREVKQVEEMS